MVEGGKKIVKIINQFPRGVITVPPSKSLSHRAAICAALSGQALSRAPGGRVPGEAGGAERVVPRNLGTSEDITATVEGIGKIAAALVAARRTPGGDAQGRIIDCGESGSTLRFLIPLAGLAGGEWVFTGRGRLLERPLGVYGEIFREHTGEGGYFIQEREAIRVRGPLLPGEYRLPGDVSSQFVTGLLLALPLEAGDSGIILTSPLESADYVELTLGVMEAYGVKVTPQGKAYEVPGGQAYRPADYTVEGDWSQGAFFLCAGALGCDVAVRGLSEQSRQGDRRGADILRAMGAAVQWEEGGLLRASPPEEGLRAVTVDVRDIPDIVPPLAAAACYARGVTRFENAGRLRLKESDRLAALGGELSRLGAAAWEEEGTGASKDALVIRGVGDGWSVLGRGLPGGEADARNDHRIAMALAVAAVGCRSPVCLTGAESVRKSYPGFWDDWEGV